MTRLLVARRAGAYTLSLTDPQRNLIDSVLLFMRDRPDLDTQLFVQVGTDHSGLTAIYEKIKNFEKPSVSLEELHVVHSSLAVAWSLFSSEEDFYVRIGFFRENVSAVAAGLVRAVGELG
jgi:hypothetical protein